MVPKPVSFKSVWNKLKCRNDIESPTTPTRSAPKRNPLVASGGSLSSLSLKKARLTVQYPQLNVVQHGISNNISYVIQIYIDQNKNIQLTERIEPEYDVYNILMDEFALNNEKEIHKSGRSIHQFSEDITFEPPPTHRLTIGPADNSPPEVGLADSSFNYLSLKSIATPGDRGGSEGMDKGIMNIGTGPQVEPGSDLWELEGEVNRRAPCNGKVGTQAEKLTARPREVDLTSGGVVDAKKISGINYMREMEDLLTFKILVATDTHLGYKEDDLYRRDDSINTFEEILYLAKTLDVDCIMHSGDLFDKNIPSRSIMFVEYNVCLPYI